MFVRMVNSCLIINMKQISLFYEENILKMRKMRKLANYVDPHHRILSDALVRIFGKPMRPRKIGVYACPSTRTDFRGGGVES